MDKANFLPFMDEIPLTIIFMIPFLIPFWLIGEILGLFLPPLGSTPPSSETE